ncbi:MAG TPA: FlgD immunoglobulin-like domain containing protein, partial [Patescibacteria group bacterium]|nr:FlgD immunoglobulin-like domain containing protein [Patescibacteria group bacterium]
EKPGADEIPKAFTLVNPYPNPFNPTTTIEFHVPQRTMISLDIYNATGEFIRNLWSDEIDPGIHRATWDGRNSNGKLVSSGIFFCRLTIGNAEVMTKKMVLLR